MADKPRHNLSIKEAASILAIFISGLSILIFTAPEKIAAANSDRLLPNMFNFMAVAAVTCVIGRWYDYKTHINIKITRLLYCIIPLLIAVSLAIYIPKSSLVFIASYIIICLWIINGKATLHKYGPAMFFVILSWGIAPCIVVPMTTGLTELAKIFGVFFAKTFLSPLYDITGSVISLKQQFAAGSYNPPNLGIIDECSGWRSLIGCIMFGYMAAVNSYLRPSYTLLLIYIAIVIAIIGNMIRIAMSISASHYNWQTITGESGHHTLGTFIMIVNMAFLFYILSIFRKRSKSDEN